MTAAALANGLLRDFKIISSNDKFEIIDPSKIRREKLRIGDREVNTRDVSGLRCIGADGKKDKKSKVILEREVDGETYITKTTDTIEHYSYTIESGNYLCFVSISLSIYNYNTLLSGMLY